MIQKRPECGYCNEPESAFTVIYGKFACANCLMKVEMSLRKRAEEAIVHG